MHYARRAACLMSKWILFHMPIAQRGITFLFTDRCTPGSYAQAGRDATERYVPV
jgi:hypothetical protein